MIEKRNTMYIIGILYKYIIKAMGAAMFNDQ